MTTTGRHQIVAVVIDRGIAANLITRETDGTITLNEPGNRRTTKLLLTRASILQVNIRFTGVHLSRVRGQRAEDAFVGVGAARGAVGGHQNVVFQGVTGSGKSYLGCALVKQTCQHRYRAHYIRMPDLKKAWATARDKSQGVTKFLKKYAAFIVPAIDEWLLDHPDEAYAACCWNAATTPR